MSRLGWWSDVVERFIPEPLAGDERARALLLVRLSFAGVAIWLLMLAYHTLAVGVPSWALGIEAVLLTLTASVPLTLRRKGSVRDAAWMLCVVAFIAMALMSLLNGGFAFHVLALTLLIPVSVPAVWPRLFRFSVVGCVSLYFALFAIAVLGLSPDATVQHTASGRLVVEGVVLFAMFFLLILISRSSSGVTYAHVRERDGYQRALLQSQKLSSLGQLADSLVHDFNNILMSMDYALYLLSESVSADDPRSEEVRHLVAAMDRAKGLSNRLESFGADGEECPTIDLDDTASKLVEVGRRLTHIETRVEFSLESRAFVDIDPTQLDQIIVNLLVNANDAIGGAGTIRVSTSANDDIAIVEVSDTGGGVPEDVRDSLFEPFFTTKAPDAGTGLGLWSSRTTAREAGGDLTFETELGVGTTMRLELPISGRHSKQAAARVADAKAPVATPLLTRTTARRRRLVRWATETITEPRGRLWAAALVMLSLSGVALWLGFAIWYLLDFNAVGVASAMTTAALLHLLVPALLRFTRSVYFAMLALGLLEMAGLAMLVIARGGFPLPVLLFLLVIPLVVNMQKEYRSLVPIALVTSLAFFGVFFGLAISTLGEPPSIVLTENQQLGESLAVLLAALALFCMATLVGQRVDAELVGEPRPISFGAASVAKAGRHLAPSPAALPTTSTTC